MKNRKTFLAVIISAAVLFAAIIGASLWSYAEFGVINPISTASGLARVVFTEEEYVEIQQYPKVIIAKPDASLDDYMAAQGYERDEERQMGALCTFTDGNFEELVIYSQNRHYSKWCWQ